MDPVPPEIVPTLAERLCPACGAAASADALACLRCGAALSSLRPAQAAQRPTPWYDQRMLLLAMLFLGFGPFSLPWLWKSKAFGVPTKLALSLAVTVYFALLCLAVVLAIGFLFETLRGLKIA